MPADPASESGDGNPCPIDDEKKDCSDEAMERRIGGRSVAQVVRESTRASRK